MSWRENEREDAQVSYRGGWGRASELERDREGGGGRGGRERVSEREKRERGVAEVTARGLIKRLNYNTKP